MGNPQNVKQFLFFFGGNKNRTVEKKDEEDWEVHVEKIK